MISITLETYWRIDGPVSSTLYALKDTIEQAQAWIASQERHYNAQGFAVKWQMFEHLTCVAKGQSELADEYTKYPYRCQECHLSYSWSVEDLSWEYEKPCMPCGHGWGMLGMVFDREERIPPMKITSEMAFSAWVRATFDEPEAYEHLFEEQIARFERMADLLNEQIAEPEEVVSEHVSSINDEYCWTHDRPKNGGWTCSICSAEYEQARAIGDRVYGPGRVQE